MWTFAAMGININIIFFVCICLHFSKGIIPDSDKKVTKFIKDYGYLVETHYLMTKDGYILEIHRIPGFKGEMIKKQKKPVLIMHGLLSSSADWVVGGPNNSLAFSLVENEYDVWLGNNRGNTFGKKHKHYMPTSYGFWDFSWHEFGIYDLPAMIDYILKITKRKDLSYICHSQGCTQFLVMGSLKPEYNKKLQFVVALAPAANFRFTKGINLHLHSLLMLSKIFVDNFGYFEFLPSHSIFRIISNHFCRLGSPLQNLCYFVLFYAAGIGVDEMDPKTFSDTFTYFPAGSSYKQVLHYHTSMMNGVFSQYDYGFEKNLRLYNSTKPPKYPIENIKVPIAVFYGSNDFLTSPGDVLFLSSKLPNLVGKFMVKGSRINHMDFLFGKNARRLIYTPLIKILNTYRKN